MKTITLSVCVLIFLTPWQLRAAEPSDVAQLIHPHPTQSEAIGEAHLALAGKPLHVHA